MLILALIVLYALIAGIAFTLFLLSMFWEGCTSIVVALALSVLIGALWPLWVLWGLFENVRERRS